jgi:hypothetical protein
LVCRALRLIQTAPFFGVGDLVGAIFFIKTPETLQLCQLGEYEVDTRRFNARSVSGLRFSYGIGTICLATNLTRLTRTTPTTCAMHPQTTEEIHVSKSRLLFA